MGKQKSVPTNFQRALASDRHDAKRLAAHRRARTLEVNKRLKERKAYREKAEAARIATLRAHAGGIVKRIHSCTGA